MDKPTPPENHTIRDDGLSESGAMLFVLTYGGACVVAIVGGVFGLAWLIAKG